MINEGYSVTSNNVKLLKHLDTLKDIQNGTIAPIMIHTIPTHRCQLKCIHCCFRNRKDKLADMDIGVFKESILQFHSLGTRALEFTGGGDPTMWPPINDAIDFLKHLGWHIGLITNGLGFDNIKRWDYLDWVRISLNSLEYREPNDLRIPDHARHTKVSFCYIFHNKSYLHINKIIDFANFHKITCRIAPDCINKPDEIRKLMEAAKMFLRDYGIANHHAFLSDFNVKLKRSNNTCRIYLIKPCLYLDGYVYACPSAELAIENDRQVQESTRICYYDKITEFYKSEKAFDFPSYNCSYCKYVDQQKLLEDLLTETEFNEFA